MKICIEKLDEPAWATYQPGVDFLIKPLSTDARKTLEKGCTSTRIEMINGRRQEAKTVDEDALELAIRDYIVVDWRGIEDQTGTPIPCTTETKIAILGAYHRIRSWVLTQATDLETLRTEVAATRERD